MSLLDFIEDNRIHFTSTKQSKDVDITVIQHGLNSELDRGLLRIVTETLQELEKMLEELQSSGRSASVGKNNINLQPFKEIQELAAMNNHYMFLASLTRVLKAKRIVEIGTASGSSLTAFLSVSDVQHVDTFDVYPLASNGNWVSTSSFSSINKYLLENQRRWRQHVTDLSDEKSWTEHLDKFAQADLIFIDAHHDSKLEKLLASRMEGLVNPSTIIVWDDVRLSSMVKFWRELAMIKIDVGGLAHYSGTGISRFPENSIST